MYWTWIAFSRLAREIASYFFRGSSPFEGSEHTVNELHGAGEAHFVFTNVITKQLSILAFFIVMSDDREQSAWCSYVDNAVELIHESTQIQFRANLMKLIETENNFKDMMADWRHSLYSRSYL
jgi:hypothetical protein